MLENDWTAPSSTAMKLPTAAPKRNLEKTEVEHCVVAQSHEQVTQQSLHTDMRQTLSNTDYLLLTDVYAPAKVVVLGKAIVHSRSGSCALLGFCIVSVCFQGTLASFYSYCKGVPLARSFKWTKTLSLGVNLNPLIPVACCLICV